MSNLNRFRYLPWITFWFVMLVVTFLFLIPQQFLLNRIFDWWDKAQHTLAFSVLMLLGFFTYPRYFLKLAIGLIVYGVMIEIIQFWSNWRQGDVIDAVADVVGVLLMGLLIKAFQSFKKGHSNKL